MLVEWFVRKYGEKYGRKLRVEKDVLTPLMEYPFYGNVRELESVVEGLIATADERRKSITARDVKAMLKGRKSEGKSQHARSAHVYGRDETASPLLTLEQLEKFAIEQALRMAEGNKTKASEMLGISRDSLYRKIHQYSISEAQKDTRNLD